VSILSEHVDAGVAERVELVEGVGVAARRPA